MTEQMKEAMGREECRIDLPIPDGMDKRSFGQGRYLGFCRGVNWYRNNVWHDSSEEPKDGAKCIVCQLGDETQTVYTLTYQCGDKNFHITGPLGCEYIVGMDWPGIRWAYPEDLLPIK